MPRAATVPWDCAHLEERIATADTTSEYLHHLPTREILAQETTAEHAQGRGGMHLSGLVRSFSAEGLQACAHCTVQHGLLVPWRTTLEARV